MFYSETIVNFANRFVRNCEHLASAIILDTYILLFAFPGFVAAMAA